MCDRFCDKEKNRVKHEKRRRRRIPLRPAYNLVRCDWKIMHLRKETTNSKVKYIILLNGKRRKERRGRWLQETGKSNEAKNRNNGSPPKIILFSIPKKKKEKEWHDSEKSSGINQLTAFFSFL